MKQTYLTVATGKNQQGFTLIELMITVTIVAILTAVAIPSYQQYVLRAKRSAAQSHMMDIAGRQGQYLLDNRAYADSVTTLSMTTPAEVSANYTIAIVPIATPPSFTVTATPSGNQTHDSCGTLTLDSAGAKTPTTGSCW